jgi:hypothetical protein
MASQDFKRKHSAILNGDAKGYSRLMGEDEEAFKRNPKISLNQVRNRLPHQAPLEVDRIVAALREAGLPD